MSQHLRQPRLRGPRNGVARARASATALATACVAGCAATAPVDATFPTPLVDPLPLKIGVVYGPDLASFTHTEAIPDERQWTVELGEANVALFNRVFSSMFAQVVRVSTPASGMEPVGSPEPGGDSTAAGGSRNGAAPPPVPESSEDALPPASAAALHGIDAVIEPSVESYEITGPKEPDVGDGFYTVWITYRMSLKSKDGRLIAEWPVRAFGKSIPRFFAADEAVAEATTMAMRDAGAYLALKFASEPRIREWLRETGKLQQEAVEEESGTPQEEP